MPQIIKDCNQCQLALSNTLEAELFYLHSFTALLQQLSSLCIKTGHRWKAQQICIRLTPQSFLAALVVRLPAVYFQLHLQYSSLHLHQRSSTKRSKQSGMTWMYTPLQTRVSMKCSLAQCCTTAHSTTLLYLSGNTQEQHRKRCTSKHP